MKLNYHHFVRPVTAVAIIVPDRQGASISHLVCSYLTAFTRLASDLAPVDSLSQVFIMRFSIDVDLHSSTRILLAWGFR